MNNSFYELDKMSKGIIKKNKIYYLKNKDRVLLEFYFDDIGVPEIIKVHENIVPEFIERKFGDWLYSRTPPKHRAFMKELFYKLQIDSNNIKEVIDYSKGLSLTDTLWVTNNNDVNWSEVSLYQNQFDYVISRIAFDGGIYGEDIKTTSPELTTDGMLPKCWVKEDTGIYLYKQGTSGAANAGYEPYSEAMATQVCEALGINHVSYEVVNFRGKLASKCLLATSENISMVPMYIYFNVVTNNLLESACLKNGIEDQFYNMLLLDYIIMNTDRHLGNFAVLVDSDDFSLKGMMPIYDNGMGCLCYYRKHLYKSLDEYIEMYSSTSERYSYAPLERIIKGSSCNPRSLLNFSFDRARLLDCPEEHIEVVESFIQKRISNLFSGIIQ